MSFSAGVCSDHESVIHQAPKETAKKGRRTARQHPLQGAACTEAPSLSSCICMWKWKNPRSLLANSESSSIHSPRKAKGLLPIQGEKHSPWFKKGSAFLCSPPMHGEPSSSKGSVRGKRNILLGEHRRRLHFSGSSLKAMLQKWQNFIAREETNSF